VTRFLLTALLPLVLLVGCGRGEPVGSAAESTPVPVAVEPTPKPGNAAAGKPTFEQYCLACHQADGRGLNGALAADFIGDTTRLAKSDAVLLDSIAEGVDGTTMIGWSNSLSEPQMRDVLAYIRSEFDSP